jgi:hypothetical protein
MDAGEMCDYEDQDSHIPLTSTANHGPYASFLQNLPDYNYMTQEEFNKAFEALLLRQHHDLRHQAFRFMQQLR